MTAPATANMKSLKTNAKQMIVKVLPVRIAIQRKPMPSLIKIILIAEDVLNGEKVGWIWW